MVKAKGLGLTIFFVCCAIYGRTAFLAPTQDELNDEVIAERHRALGEEPDHLGVLHGLRYYILGIGVIGLLIAVEDHYSDKAKKRKAAKAASSLSPPPPPAAERKQ